MMKKYSALLFFNIVFSGSVVSQSSIPQLNLYKLKNGLEIYFSEYQTLPVANFDIFIGAGKTDETPGLQSVAQITSQAILRGNKKYNRIEQDNQLSELGTSISVSSNEIYTHISIKILNSDLATGVELLAAILTQPTFYNNEVNEIVNEMIEISKPSYMDINVLAQHFSNFQIYGSANPLGRYSYPKQLNKIDSSQIKKFYEFNYTPKNTKIIINGKYDKVYLKTLIEKNFENWNAAITGLNVSSYRDRPINKKEFAFVHRNNATQACLIWNMKAPSSRTSDALAFKISLILFNRTLFKEVREKKGKTYGIYSQYEENANKGMFSISTQTRSEELYNTILAVDTVLTEFNEYKVTDEDIRLAKTRLKNELLSIEDPADWAIFFNPLVYKNLNKRSKYLALIEKIDAKKLNKIIKKYFKPDAYKLMIAGNENELNKQLSYLPGLLKMPLTTLEVDQ